MVLFVIGMAFVMDWPLFMPLSLIANINEIYWAISLAQILVNKIIYYMAQIGWT